MDLVLGPCLVKARLYGFTRRHQPQGAFVHRPSDGIDTFAGGHPPLALRLSAIRPLGDDVARVCAVGEPTFGPPREPTRSPIHRQKLIL